MTNQRVPARKAIRHKVRDDNCIFFFCLQCCRWVSVLSLAGFVYTLKCRSLVLTLRFLGGTTVTVLDCLRQTHTLTRFPLLSLLVSHVSVVPLTFIRRLALTAALCRCQSVITSLVGFRELCQCLNSPSQRGALWLTPHLFHTRTHSRTHKHRVKAVCLIDEPS